MLWHGSCVFLHGKNGGKWARPLRAAGVVAGRGMRRLESLIAFLLCIFFIAHWTEASAATLGRTEPVARPWTTPGTHPCNDLCDRDWALAKMRDFLPAEAYRQLEQLTLYGTPAEYYVSSGDTILAMTYSNGGIAYMDPSLRIARFPEGTSYHASGYLAVVDDTGYRFVRIDLCGNWALIVGPSGGMLSSGEIVPGIDGGLRDLVIGSVFGGIYGGIYGGTLVPHTGGRIPLAPFLVVPGRPQPPVLTVVPLTATLYLLGTAVAALFVVGGRRRSAAFVSALRRPKADRRVRALNSAAAAMPKVV